MDTLLYMILPFLLGVDQNLPAKKKMTEILLLILEK